MLGLDCRECTHRERDIEEVGGAISPITIHYKVTCGFYRGIDLYFPSDGEFTCPHYAAASAPLSTFATKKDLAEAVKELIDDIDCLEKQECDTINDICRQVKELKERVERLEGRPTVPYPYVPLPDLPPSQNIPWWENKPTWYIH